MDIITLLQTASERVDQTVTIEETPFPKQRIQTDRGREFLAKKVQEWLRNLPSNSGLLNPADRISTARSNEAIRQVAGVFTTQDLRDPDSEMKLFE